MRGQDGGRRRFVGLGGALAAAGLWWPAPAEAAGAAISASGGRTRVEVPVDAGTAWRLSAAKDPPRLILELPGTVWRGPARLPGAGLVAEARRAGNALVLLLAAPVAAPVTGAGGPGRLVIELFPGTAAGFAWLAHGRALAAAPPPPRTLPLVVLDPGHGGRDPGAIGGKGTLEKRITLLAALETKRRLEAGGRCRVLLTRGRDAFVPLADRIGLARRREAALFLSLHADSAPGARGASVYTLSETASDALSAALARRENGADRAGGLRLPSVSPEVSRILFSLMRQETRAGSDRLARLAVSSLRREVPLLHNAHRRAAFVVLKAPDVPAALVEMGFLSDPADEAALNRPAHRARLAGALAGAVEGFLLARDRSSLAAAEAGGGGAPAG